MAHFLPLPKELQDKIYYMSNSPTPTASVIKNKSFEYKSSTPDLLLTANDKEFIIGSCYNDAEHLVRYAFKKKLMTLHWYKQDKLLYTGVKQTNETSNGNENDNQHMQQQNT